VATETHDNAITIASLGLLAYASADIAHHVLGHGGACLALGGSIVSLSSVFVNCSLHGATIDLAGPLANLALGLAALLVAGVARPTATPTRLFWVLVAAFNLMWFSGQLVFSVATGTDDWAWAMHRFSIGAPGRYGLIAVGALCYFVTYFFAAAGMVNLSHPRARARRIILIVWLTAGVTACATAALDHDAVRALLLQAMPQSFLLSIGLLWVPARAASRSTNTSPAAAVSFSVRWVIGAAIVGVASILVLGPGMIATN